MYEDKKNFIEAVLASLIKNLPEDHWETQVSFVRKSIDQCSSCQDVKSIENIIREWLVSAPEEICQLLIDRCENKITQLS